MTYPKRLIEVDLPIKRISAHARREKSIRHGHISTLHIWSARRPLAACRAVICASLWPDPADPDCPQAFRDAAARLITEFARRSYNKTSLHATASTESFGRWEGIVAAEARASHSTRTTRLTSTCSGSPCSTSSPISPTGTTRPSANISKPAGARPRPPTRHSAASPAPGRSSSTRSPAAVRFRSRPCESGPMLSPSDLNPVAVLLNKVVLEYIPKYGQRLADEVRKWGEWIKSEAEKELAEFYPKDPDGATPIAYLWARTISMRGPRLRRRRFPLSDRSGWPRRRTAGLLFSWKRDPVEGQTEVVEDRHQDSATTGSGGPCLKYSNPKSPEESEKGTSSGSDVSVLRLHDVGRTRVREQLKTATRRRRRWSAVLRRDNVRSREGRKASMRSPTQKRYPTPASLLHEFEASGIGQSVRWPAQSSAEPADTTCVVSLYVVVLYGMVRTWYMLFNTASSCWFWSNSRRSSIRPRECGLRQGRSHLLRRQPCLAMVLGQMGRLMLNPPYPMEARLR